MEKILIKDTEELFNKWKNTVQELSTLNSIIQNEGIIPLSDAQNFVSDLTKGVNKLNEVGMEIVDYLKSNIIKDGKIT